MKKKVIYIEGTSDTDNGSLRKAFAKLFEKELKNRMPQVIMGDGKEQTIDKFLTKPLVNNECRFLLIDSDQQLSSDTKQIMVMNIDNRDVNKKQDASTENVFFMVQEAEAWILSQPNILKSVGLKVNLVPKQHVTEISKPSIVLSNIYKKSGQHYHKVIEFVKVFPLLDTPQLRKDFEEFNSLIDALQ